MNTRHNHGFTLIELSIVLVIIGLIVGGVLVGQDLINAAQIRNVISQQERFNTATHTFKLKYNGLPGDLRNPSTFGFPSAGLDICDATTCMTRGNSLIESTTPAFATGNHQCVGAGGETTHYWYQLSQAKLISDTINEPPAGAMGALTSEEVKEAFPESGMDGNMWHICTQNSLNYFALWKTESIGSTGVHRNQNGVTPMEAYQIDSKVDDGVPLTGTVRPLIRFLFNSASHIMSFETPGPSSCTLSSTEYNTADSSAADTKFCGLGFKSAF